MDQASKEILEEILRKDKNSITEGEKQFLLARRGYLNDEQRERFADLIEAHEASLGESGDGLDDMKPAELKALAEERGVDLTGLTRKADIIAAIRAAAPAEEAA